MNLTACLVLLVKEFPVRFFPISSFLLAGTLASVVNALPVEAPDARRTAEGWLQARLAPGQDRQVREARPWPTATQPSAWLLPLEPEGFVLISGDSGLRPVLGWSEQGNCPQQWPVAMMDFLESVGQQHHQLLSQWPQGAPRLEEWDQVEAGVAGAFRDVGVLPLLSCNWDQGAGWNQFCPMDGAGPGGRVYAGCVATSMVQVMHYWQQPWHGEGSHGYMSDYGWLEADFGAATYDWNAMLPNSPTPEAAYVMYHAGIAVDMMYAPDGSGAYVGVGNPNAMSAMRDHFGFLPSLQFIRKDSFTWNSWRNRLRQELDAGRPILHSGYGSGGHAFNIDGWRENDYFHLNWGWSGSYNGWFLVDALNPGGNDFSQGQGAVVNLVPTDYQAAPAMLHPLNNGTDIACSPLTLEWAEADGALSYELMVDEGTDFISPVISLVGLESTSQQVTELNPFSQYYWRIRSRGEQGTGPWSAAAGFLTAYWDQTPAPQPATPMDGAVNVNVNPTVLVWNFVVGAAEYRVQVAADADFTQIVADSSGVLTNYALFRHRLDEGQTYWWRAQCLGLADWSEWSTVRHFTTMGGTAVDAGATPLAFALHAAWPNPFNPSTRLAFTLDQAGPVTLSVWSVLGERMATLLDMAPLGAGRHELNWQASHLPSGMYLVELRSGGQRAVQKLSLLR